MGGVPIRSRVGVGKPKDHDPRVDRLFSIISIEHCSSGCFNDQQEMPTRRGSGFGAPRISRGWKPAFTSEPKPFG